jgi:hypothetical protein
MDPKETLKEIRELYRAIIDWPYSDADALNLAELIESLDLWILRGGFCPWDQLSTPGLNKDQSNG